MSKQEAPPELRLGCLVKLGKEDNNSPGESSQYFMKAPSDLNSALQRHFSFPGFRPGQREALELVLAGADTLVVMPTGHGKSLIYQLAALLLPGTALVVSPLISLMKDQVDSLVRRGIAATFINSTLNAAHQNQRLQKMAEGDYKIVLIAPERLRSRRFNTALSRVSLNLLVVDEAHCLSQWGHDFRPDYLHIADMRQNIEIPVTLALTATATRKVQDDIINLLNLPHAERLVTGFNRPNLSLEVFSTPDVRAKLELLHEFLCDVDGAGIIYTGTRRDAEEVAEFASETLNLPACCYHAGLEFGARTEVQDAFMAGDLSLVAATNAFGMGIDRPDVRFVLHYTMPSSLEAYYQEAGRGGRDGLPARALLFYSPQDTSLHEFFIENASPSIEELRIVHKFLVAPRASSQGEEPGMRIFHLDELIRATDLREVKARVALEQLEAAQALTRAPGDIGNLIRVQPRSFPEAALQKIRAQVKARQLYRRAMLEKMVDYAETNNCRRRVILDHFGDSGQADAPICCDNCLSRAETDDIGLRPAKTQAERAALIALDTIARLQWGLGKGKIGRILKGSSAKNVAQYAQHRHYGKFAALRIGEIEALIDQLLKSGYIKAVGSNKPTLAITPKGQTALTARAAIEVELRGVRRDAIQRLEVERQVGGTIALTKQMLANGLSPEQIAAERALTVRTIFSHLARLIAQGELNVRAVITEDVLKEIYAAIKKVGSAERLAPIKACLPDEIDYGPIRCAVEARKLGQRDPDLKSSKSDVQRIIIECVRSLPGKIPRSGVAKLLVGSKSVRIEQYSSNPFYNRLAGKRRSEILAVVDTLLQAEVLAQDESKRLILPSQDPHLSKTEADPLQDNLYEYLRAWRLEKAGAMSKPAFVVFSDETLRGIASTLPRTTSDLLEIRGIGPAKVNQFGEEVLTIVNEFLTTKNNFLSKPDSSVPSSSGLPKEATIDPVTSFLSRPHPRPLDGPWQAGWALDFHSRFVGKEQVRGVIGDLVYRYKYQGEHQLADELAQRWADLLGAHPEIPQPEAVVPVPPSTPRKFDPVIHLARALAARLGIQALNTALVKTRSTQPQKELKSMAAKQANVRGAFTTQGAVAGMHLLLVDDLYDSGATLSEAARSLGRGHPASIVALTLTKTIHADR